MANAWPNPTEPTGSAGEAAAPQPPLEAPGLRPARDEAAQREAVLAAERAELLARVPRASDRLWAWSRGHLAESLSLLYLALCFCGYLHGIIFFWQFDVWYPHFAGPSDLLLSGLREPGVLLAVFGALAFVWLNFLVDRRFRRFGWYNALFYRYRWQERLAYSRVMIVLLFLLLPGLYLFNVTSDLAGAYDHLRQDDVRVVFREGPWASIGERTFLLAGTTEGWLMLRERTATLSRTHVVPRDAVAAITPLPLGQRPDLPAGYLERVRPHRARP